MDDREQRYRQKINFVIEKVKSFPSRPTNSTEVDALLYRVQVAIEAVVDIVAMLVKDKGYSVSDDYHNIDQMIKLKVVNLALGEELKKLNGLRNAIVHKYNAFEEETVVKNKEKIGKVLIAFLTQTEHELKTIFKNNKK